MDKELTEIDKKSSDIGIVCSNDRAGSTPPPSRVEKLDHQGARFRCTQIGSIWPATVAAPRTGGASQSKWARKTRPWNASLRVTVVAFISIEKSCSESIECIPKPPYGAVGTHDVLRCHSRRRWQGFRRGSLRLHSPSWAAASASPPSGLRLGGGGHDLRRRYWIDATTL